MVTIRWHWFQQKLHDAVRGYFQLGGVVEGPLFKYRALANPVTKSERQPLVSSVLAVSIMIFRLQNCD
jgi:hypothetical protein